MPDRGRLFYALTMKGVTMEKTEHTLTFGVKFKNLLRHMRQPANEADIKACVRSAVQSAIETEYSIEESANGDSDATSPG